MAAAQPGTSPSAQASDNRIFLCRLQMLIIDGGLAVLRNYVDQKLSAQTITLSGCLANEKTTINLLKRRGIITQVQYDILYPTTGIVSTSDLDITLIICLIRNLKCFKFNKKYNWNISPGQSDTSIEADICRLKIYRNEICHISTTTGIQYNDFCTKWKEIEQILLRFDKIYPIKDFHQTITGFEYSPLDPKTEQRVSDEIEKWEKHDKAVEADIQLLKAGHKKTTEELNTVKTEEDEIEERLPSQHTSSIIQEIELMKKQITELQLLIKIQGLPTHKVTTVKASVILRALEQKTAEELTNVLLTVAKESLTHLESPEPNKTVRKMVDNLVQDMNDKGFKVEDVSEGSIVYTIKCQSFEDLIALIDYFDSPMFKKHLEAISRALTEVTGKKIEIHSKILTGPLSEELRRHEYEIRHSTRKRKLPVRPVRATTDNVSIKQVWKKCVESSDEKAAEQLLKDDVIPDQETLNLACSNFGRKHQIVKDMCTKVCTYIQKLQPDIIRFVWPSYRYVIETPFEQYSENDVVFVVVTQSGKKHSIKEVKMFKTYIRESSETSQESREINKLEGKTTQCGDNEMKRKRRRIVKCMEKNVDNLLEKHSNITSISASLFKSRHFQLGKLNTEDNLCIVLYVHVKGYIPLHEDPFDQKIDEYDVDVRECVFTPLMIGPNDFHSILKMGLEIGITSDPNAPGKESKIGTIGHFERKCFVTCAHVVMAIDELLKLSEKQMSGKERDINIYQPLKQESRKICGRVIRAVYDEKTGRNNVGVDAALVEIMDRKSTRYEFPHSDILENLGLTGNLSKVLQTGIYRPNHDRHIEVIKYGCVSNVTKGSYTLVSNPIVTLEALGIRLRNQIAIVPTEEFQHFAVEGDSGAVVFESMDGKLYPTCMIEGTMGDGRIVATPLINVLVSLGIKNPEDEIKLYDDESDESDMDEGPL